MKSASYLNNGVNDPKRDFRDELTELMEGRIEEDLVKFSKDYPELKCLKNLKWKIEVAECPLGWNVSLSFKKPADILGAFWIAGVIAKTIGTKFLPEKAYRLETSKGFVKKIEFPADLVPYRE